MTIHVHKKFRRALSFANNIRLAEPKIKPGIECLRKYLSRKNYILEKHVTNHMSPPHLHLLMARQDNTNN